MTALDTFHLIYLIAISALTIIFLVHTILTRKKFTIKDMTFLEYFQFAIEKIRSFIPKMKLPDNNQLREEIGEIINTSLYKRLGHNPNNEEIEDMLDGERFEISMEIAKRIGTYLNKALYYRFKNKRRNS